MLPAILLGLYFTVVLFSTNRLMLVWAWSMRRFISSIFSCCSLSFCCPLVRIPFSLLLMLPFSLTTANASSSHHTLVVMTIVAVIFTPIVLIYQSWTYWVFRKRVTVAHIPEPIADTVKA